ncbi:CzcA family heavy metal efflux pump [Rhodoblastus acidophilus]|uniref:efflux RND transporter permease subunit n=1 Tax=Rhodoblastus acidophilus TaxID=1074 RepID=UPI00222540E4|nr:efflux RND transporter permease subunit [Rhodoblastus acidophilus]MCW2283250.1 CzcA family heavy metal efflux pump [Rhodoblastus acidophilus]MCW2332110.1 CzcA family heavy metal efflux pump [Rhodoblastus acidophilus]
MEASSPGSSGFQAHLIAAAIRRRWIVLGVSFLLLVFGVDALTRAKYDVFPEFAPPQVNIQTEAPGLAALEVEALVTQPLENAIAGAIGVKTLRSTSTQGLSVVTVTFAMGSEARLNRQIVAEHVASAAQNLPAGVKPPVLTPLTSSSSTILIVGLTSKSRDLMDVRTVADSLARPRLLAVPGVAKVAVFGGELRSLQFQARPEDLIRAGIGLDEVVAAARGAIGAKGLGLVETPNQRLPLRADAPPLSAKALGEIVLASNGSSRTRLADVADVTQAPEPAIGGASVMGRTGVVLQISGQYGANTVEVTECVEAALAGLRPTLEREGIDLDATLFRPANFVAVTKQGVGDALLLGGALVIVVLFLFLFDIRTAAISSIAIPLSLLVAVLVLDAWGFTLNAMTLGGLAIAIGEVVDDAVIDVENIVRRLRENRAKAEPRPAAQVVLDASLEVRGAVVHATMIVMLVFLPVLTLPGVAGSFFRPLALAYLLALIASLATALIVTPALCMTLLGGEARKTSKTPPLTTALRRPFEAALSIIARRPRAVMATVIAATLGALTLPPFFQNAFLPEFKEGHYTLHMTNAPGSSIAESLRIGGLATDLLSELKWVRSVSQRVGRAELADDTGGTNASEIEVDLKPGLNGAQLSRADREVRKSIEEFPGARFSLKPFLTERIEEVVAGNGAAVAINVFGDDLAALDQTAAQILAVLEKTRGSRDARLRAAPSTPEISIRLRDDDLTRWGLRPAQVMDVVRIACQGEVVGQVHDGPRAKNVIATLAPGARNAVEKIADLPLRAGNGAFIALRDVADVAQTTGRAQIDHLGAHRMVTVATDVSEADVGAFVARARKAVAAQVNLPRGVYVEFTGAAEAEAQTRRDLIQHALFAFAGVVLVLSLITRNARNLALVLLNLPFALIGGVLAVQLQGAVLTIGSMVGFVALFGISLRNSIMMISHYHHLVTVEGMDWSLATAIKGAGDRLIPIVMTSLVTALGLAPLAIGAAEPGREVQGPMATVILGGLISSLLLNLFVLPTLAHRFGRFGRA